MIILNSGLAFLILASVLFLLYALVFVRPRKCGIKSSLAVDYAHRGLHGKDVPENSLLAFERSIDKGVGIELDVQLSKDGVVMVFHDYTLSRMTGDSRELSAVDSCELMKLSLSGSEERIPSFSEVLELVDGKVPLLVELKGESFDTSLCEKTARLLRNYKGEYCVESFNPLLLKEIKKHLPDVYCGQLYTNVCRDKGKCSALNVILTAMAFNFLSRPDFIAFNKEDRDSLPVKITTRFYKSPKFVWTIKNKAEFETAKRLGEYPIFEGIYDN